MLAVSAATFTTLLVALGVIAPPVSRPYGATTGSAPAAFERLSFRTRDARQDEWLYVEVVDDKGHTSGFYCVERRRPDLLLGRLAIDDVVQHTSVPGLDMIGTGAFPDNPAELVLRKEMKQFLAEASARYDLVILDAPPVLVVSESTVIAAQADGTLMVVWSGRTSRKLVHVSVRQLLSRGATLLGCVLNNLDLTRMGSYGASGYYHYYGYDYRYEEDAVAGTPGSTRPPG